MTESILIKNGTIVTMDAENSIVRGDLLIRDGRIAAIGERNASHALMKSSMRQAARCCLVLFRPTFIFARHSFAERLTICR